MVNADRSVARPFDAICVKASIEIPNYFQLPGSGLSGLGIQWVPGDCCQNGLIFALIIDLALAANGPI